MTTERNDRYEKNINNQVYSDEEIEYLSNDTNTFFSKLLELRDVLHMEHLRQSSGKYSTHIALEEAYTSLLDKVDSLIEGYTGLYYPPSLRIELQSRPADIIDYVSKFYKVIDNAKTLFVDGWIISDLDDIQKSLAILLYKLKYM